MNFSENLLQFIWQYRLLKPLPLRTAAGNEIVVLKTGARNPDAGPDFFNAQIRINQLVLAGNIEVHIKTSDWLKHKHQHNKSYDNLILHVVYEHDLELAQNANNNVEVLELKHLIDKSTLTEYERLASAKSSIACKGQLVQVNDFKFLNWLERLTIERLENKVKHIEKTFATFGNDYTQTFYAVLLRNFGFKTNAQPFEQLALALPMHLLLKHSDNLLQLEALLLGTSGLLDEQFENDYIRQLQNEFEYLKTKYQLVPLPKEMFKFSKLRPANFPNLRLAQLAQLLHKNKRIFTEPQNIQNLSQLKIAFELELKGYWKNHYTLHGGAQEKNIHLGNASIEIIAINTFAPFFFFYAQKLMKPEFQDIAVQLLQECKAETNSKTKLFAEKNGVLKTAADSQALIQLHDNYCVLKQCLKCGVAASLLAPRGLA
ncbi:MAG: DUF2851 family protein [Bacteroidetes bacterium]|nr:DUF2851 family protein [Bacteroidota bacterium]